MRIIINVLLVLCVTNVVAQQQAYPALDQGLIALWEDAYNGDSKKCKATMLIVLNEWDDVKPEILKINNLHFDNATFIEDTESLVNTISILIYERSYSQAEYLIYQVLWDFSSMRNCLGVDDYPLDLLLKTHLTYKQIHYTVHNEMMGLRYWFEFQELVDDFVEYWGGYDSINIDEEQKYFPAVQGNSHQYIKEKLNRCLSDFLKSLETGCRNDFEMPCDEMGDALRELIFLYQEDTDI